MVFAQVSCKGPDPSVVSAVCGDLEMLGRREAVFKTDQEPAIVALQWEVVSGVPGLAAENSAVAHSATNGMAENAARRATGMTRTLKSAPETTGGVPRDGVGGSARCGPAVPVQHG